jgi:hypothetical protein
MKPSPREISRFRHIPGTEMRADALTKALGGVKLGEFVEEIGLR